MNFLNKILILQDLAEALKSLAGILENDGHESVTL